MANEHTSFSCCSTPLDFKGLLHGSKIFLSNVVQGETAAVSGHILLGKDCEHPAHSQVFLRHLRHRALPARRITRQVRTNDIMSGTGINEYRLRAEMHGPYCVNFKLQDICF
jgi:hypothetical protein